MSSTALVVDASTPTEPQPRSQKEAAAVSPGGEWALVRALARQQLDRFISLEPKVLRGDNPDAIHNMRVASRRLQQVFDLLYPPPPAKEIRKLRRVMQRSRRSLSEVRNCDVLLEQVAARLARKRTAHRETWTAVLHYLQHRRSAQFEKAARKLSKMNLAVFYVHLKSHLNGNGTEARNGRHALTVAEAHEMGPKEFYERITHSLEEVSQAFESEIAQSRRDPRGPVIHGARIGTKRLRYLFEVIREFGVSGSDESFAWLRKLQQLLGEWHDLLVLEDIMIEMVARPEFLRDHLDDAMDVERLILRTRTARKRLEEKYFLMTLDSPEFQQLKEWVAYLLSSPSAAFAKA